MNFLKRSSLKKKTRRPSMGMAESNRWRLSTKKIDLTIVDTTDVEGSDSSETFSQDVGEDIDWEEYFLAQKDDISETSEQDQEIFLTKKQTLILATMVPNELVLMDDYESSKKFVGVLLMADVSGFTALSEKYNSLGQGGAYRLTMTLNTYLGSLIEIIYSHGGDIIKFAGDAFLALWKHDKKSYLCHTIHTVITCCLLIQHLYCTYETDVKVTLKVKLAISAGNLVFAPIGKDCDKSYVLTGLPVFEAKDAESMCASGEVKLSPTAWGHCYSRNYDHIQHEDGHVTIKSILYDPRETNINKPFGGLGVFIRQVKHQFSAIETLPNDLWDETKTPNVVENLTASGAVSLRQSILESIKKNNGADLRKFMIRPVVQQIDGHQPLEYLTEMRQVTIMFITLKPHKCSILHLITILNKAYEITSDIVYKAMGCVNKIILFDKDVMILVIFGLRGFKHESESQAALKSAYNIKKHLSVLDGVLQVSIGLTTGPVYCGVVGHRLRREFTVIGSIVNKAARLMCNYRNKITCDEVTFMNSKLSVNNFILQPPKELKGILHCGKIYEYTENIRLKEINNIPIIRPLLNRTVEMDHFNNYINNISTTRQSNEALMFVGESRVGKSKLLQYMEREAKNKGINTCSLILTSIHTATPYLAITQLLNQLLHINEPPELFEKEEKIVRLIIDYNDDLCYLNDVLKTRFAYNENVFSQNAKNKSIKEEAIFKKLITAIPDAYIIFIDDLDNLDPASWKFLSLIIMEYNRLFVVLSIQKNKIKVSEDWQHELFVSNNIKKFLMGPLEGNLVSALACQILDVEAVPNELCYALEIKCKRLPGAIETQIFNLFSGDILDVQKITIDEFNGLSKNEYQFPESDLIKPIALNESDQLALAEFLKNTDQNEKKVCVITDMSELYATVETENFDALVIMQIDSLTPYQQLLLKIASVIGTIVPRELLENIMYENNSLITAKAVKRLFSMNLLTCASTRVRWSRKSQKGLSTICLSNNMCECCFDYDTSEYNLPKYAYCKLMKFRSVKSKNTCYELLPMNQKKEFHTRIVNYLEQSDVKCVDCGGLLLVVQSFSAKKSSAQINIDYNMPMVVQYNSVDAERTSEISSTQSIAKTKSDIGERLSEHLDRESTDRFDSMTYNQTSRRPSILKTRHDSDSDLIINERRMAKRVTIPNITIKALNLEESEKEQVTNKVRMILDGKHWEEMGLQSKHEEKNASYSIILEKGASETNFKSCTCIQTNILLNEELIYHALEADLKVKAIEFIIKYSRLNIKQNKLKDTIEKLNIAENMCNDPEIENLSKFDKKRLLGKIYTLLSEANYLEENYLASKIYIERAFSIYNINFKRFSMSSFDINKKRKKLRGKEAIIAQDRINCNIVGSMLYEQINEDRYARIAACKALNLLQKTDCSITQICEVYSNAIDIEISRGNPEQTSVYEYAADISFREFVDKVKATELFEIGKFFLTSFQARIARGYILPAIRSGYRSLAISRFVCADPIAIEIIPDLFYLLLAKKRIKHAVSILSELILMNKNNNIIEYDIWYYALCMDMVLDAGFQLEHPGSIIRFAELTPKRGDCIAWKRLILNIWIYCMRSSMERRAKKWETEALKWTTMKDANGTFTTLFNALRLGEGMLETLSKKVNDLKKVVDLMELRSLAEKGLNDLEKDFRLCRPLLPRWLILKSCCCKLSGRWATANNYMALALDEARKSHNHLELARASYSSSNYWTDSSNNGNFLNWDEALEQVEDEWPKLAYRFTIIKRNLK